MYLFNISFVVSGARKDPFISWARRQKAVEEGFPGLKDFSLLRIAAVPGDPEFTKQKEKNFSLQLKFGTLSECRKWHEERFQALMDSYAEWHGPNPLFFASILQRHEL